MRVNGISAFIQLPALGGAVNHIYVTVKCRCLRTNNECQCICVSFVERKTQTEMLKDSDMFNAPCSVAVLRLHFHFPVVKNFPIDVSAHAQ